MCKISNHNVICYNQNKMILISYDFWFLWKDLVCKYIIAVSLATTSTISKPKFIHNM